MSEWISVKERLPELELGNVLCAIDGDAWQALDEEHYECSYEGPIMIANTIFAREWAGYFVTHWQPLPPIPSKEAE